MVIHKETMRSANEKSVLQRIFTEGPISKSQVARDVSLNKVTVSQIINKFIESKLVIEAGSGKSTQQGGRKPELLQINSNYGYVSCIELGYQELSMLFMSISGQVLDSKKMTLKDNDINCAIEKIIETLNDFQDNFPEHLLGIAISIHGIVHKNQVIYSPFWDMQQIDLADLLTEQFGVPIILENEANLTAVFEQDYGKIEARNAVSISMHRGIGAGIIIGGELYRGHKGEAGEIGQAIAFDSKNQPLRKTKKIEDICSPQVILEQIKKAKKIGYINWELVRQMFDDNDQVTLEILKSFKDNVAKIISNVIVSFDPDVLVMNAYIFKEFPEFLELISNELDKISVRNTSIILSENIDNASLYGGCAQMIRTILGVSKLKLQYKK
ncbi:ROK family protein [Pediococcus pentosaceus]|uniref:ROK family protein n=1 Tax=Pediococcus pentosaceus TaxID=1255 RepID=UPI00237F2A81|nr:ROK family protein [Pediococcus pentosaceus]MDE3750836.1 ROK family protein [Pediococcus pentosaceus]